jgi:RNA polymerase sigma factor (sigma-70 family)
MCGIVRRGRRRAVVEGAGVVWLRVTVFRLVRLYEQQGRSMQMPLDADAIARLYDFHAEEMLGFFVRRTYDPEASMDLVAETFAVGFADRSRFRGISDEEALGWLYGIARHRLADYLRRGRLERRALHRLGFQRRPLSPAEYERIEELAGLGEMRETIDVALHELGAEHRVALQLRVVEERSYEQVAAALGVTEQTARARVSRALAAMRQLPAVQALIEGRERAI